MRVPPFMLKRIYVPGSLRRDGHAVHFQLKNVLATATITGPPRVGLNQDDVATDKILLETPDQKIAAADAKDVVFAKGMTVTVRLIETALSPGTHRILLAVPTKEWDVLEFQVEDTLAA